MLRVGVTRTLLTTGRPGKNASRPARWGSSMVGAAACAALAAAAAGVATGVVAEVSARAVTRRAASAPADGADRACVKHVNVNVNNLPAISI